MFGSELYTQARMAISGLPIPPQATVNSPSGLRTKIPGWNRILNSAEDTLALFQELLEPGDFDTLRHLIDKETR
jgi:hypothetical protein